MHQRTSRIERAYEVSVTLLSGVERGSSRRPLRWPGHCSRGPPYLCGVVRGCCSLSLSLSRAVCVLSVVLPSFHLLPFDALLWSPTPTLSPAATPKPVPSHGRESSAAPPPDAPCHVSPMRPQLSWTPELSRIDLTAVLCCADRRLRCSEGGHDGRRQPHAYSLRRNESDNARNTRRRRYGNHR